MLEIFSKVYFIFVCHIIAICLAICHSSVAYFIVRYTEMRRPKVHTALHRSAPLRTAPHRTAVPCRAVPCRAVPCRAVSRLTLATMNLRTFLSCIVLKVSYVVSIFAASLIKSMYLSLHLLCAFFPSIIPRRQIFPRPFHSLHMTNEPWLFFPKDIVLSKSSLPTVVAVVTPGTARKGFSTEEACHSTSKTTIGRESGSD